MMSTLPSWHLWTCDKCGNRAAVLTDTWLTCMCGTVAEIDATVPLVTDEDYDDEDLWR